MKFIIGNIEIGVTGKFRRVIPVIPPLEERLKEGDPRNDFRICILHKGIQRYFTYFGSPENYVNNRTVMNEEDLRNALRVTVEDGIFTFRNFKHFLQETGMKETDPNSEICYLEMLKTQYKLKELGLTREDLHSIAKNV